MKRTRQDTERQETEQEESTYRDQRQVESRQLAHETQSTDISHETQLKLIQLQRENQLLKINSKRDQDRILQLEKDRQFLYQQQQQKRVIKESPSKPVDLQYKQKYFELEHLYEELNVKFVDLTRRMELQKSEQQLAIDSLTKSNHSYQQQIQEFILRHRELEKMKQPVPVADHSIVKDDFTVLTNKMSELKQKNQKLEAQLIQLGKERKWLKQMQENSERLKEEKKALETKIDLYKTTYIPQINQLIKANMEFICEKKRWMNLIEAENKHVFMDNNMDDILVALQQESGPYLVVKELCLQRTRNRLLVDQIKKLEEFIQDLKQQIQVGQEQSFSMEQSINNLTTQKEQGTRSINKLEKSNKLLTREISFLKEQLKSYDAEEELTNQRFDQLKNVRIEELNLLLQDYKQQIESFIVQPTPLPVTVPIQNPPKDPVIQPSDLLAQTLVLQQEIVSRNQEIELLKSALKEHQFLPEHTRILQLATNPELQEYSIRKQTMDKLRKENEELRKHIAGQSTSISYPQESIDQLESEIKSLSNALQEKDKRLDRLKQVYAVKANEYREAVYKLLGYKCDLQQDGQVRLTSMFHSSKFDISFIVTQGSLRILTKNQELMQLMNEQVEFFVNQHQCVAVFMAWVTMKGFSMHQ